MAEASNGSRTAIILIDHGSKVAAANELLERVAERLREKGEAELVEVAHMELAEPTLEQAFQRCKERGAARVIVVPYFLAEGRHAGQDIPRMAAEAAAAHPELEWTVAEPLGLDDRMVSLVARRAAEAAGRKWAD